MKAGNRIPIIILSTVTSGNTAPAHSQSPCPLFRGWRMGERHQSHHTASELDVQAPHRDSQYTAATGMCVCVCLCLRAGEGEQERVINKEGEGGRERERLGRYTTHAEWLSHAWGTHACASPRSLDIPQNRPCKPQRNRGPSAH